MEKFLARILKYLLRFAYVLIKMRPAKDNKVVFMSRESNGPSLDFIELQKYLQEKRPDLDIEILCKKMKAGFLGSVKYFFHIWRQMWALASCKVCIVDTYIIPICVLNHKKSLKVIQIWHAVGTVKKFGYQTLGKDGGRDQDIAKIMDMHRGYDLAVSGSEAMRGAFAQAFHMGEDKIVLAWPPKLDYLIKDEQRIRQAILEKYPPLGEKETILYAPTYRRNGDYYIDGLMKEMDFSKYCLIIKGHPARDMNRIDQRALYCPDFSASQLLAAADIVITDYSAISIEAAALGKRVYFYVYDLKEYTKSVGLNIDLYQEMPGCVYEQAGDLAAALGRDYNQAARDAFAQKYAPPSAAGGAEKIGDLALAHLEERVIS